MSQNIILIPSYNEKIQLIKIIKKLKHHNILIMDDGSSDKTSSIVKNSKKISLIRNKKNLGYEKNLLKGFKNLLNKKYTYIITFDADGEHDFRDIKKFNDYLKLNKPDLLIGNRRIKNRLAEKILSFFFKFKISIEDPLSGFKAYKIKNLKNVLNQIKHNFFLVDIITLFKARGYSITNININSNKIKKRNPKIGGYILVSLKILKCLKLLF